MESGFYQEMRDKKWNRKVYFGYVRGISTLRSGIASEMETILQIQIYE